MKFSVIVPCYNVSPWLRECLDSVLAQTFKDWECICIDDGSQDETGRILDEYAEVDSRIIVIHQENKGEGGARTSGVCRARGDWLVYLDGDDVWHTRFLESIYEVWARFPDVELIKVLSISFEDGHSIDWGEEDALACFYTDFSSILPLSVYSGGFWCIAYRREIVKNLRFDKGLKVGEDRCYLGSVIAITQNMVTTNVRRYAYRQRPTSAAHAKLSVEKFRDELAWRRYQANLWRNESRTIPTKDLRFSALALIEFNALDYFSLPHIERKRVWTDFISTIREFRGIKRIPCWPSFVMSLLSLIPFEPILFILGAVPMWLKKKGIHR